MIMLDHFRPFWPILTISDYFWPFWPFFTLSLAIFFSFFLGPFWHQRIYDTTLSSRDIAMWRFLWRGEQQQQELGILGVRRLAVWCQCTIAYLIFFVGTRGPVFLWNILLVPCTYRHWGCLVTKLSIFDHKYVEGLGLWEGDLQICNHNHKINSKNPSMLLDNCYFAWNYNMKSGMVLLLLWKVG